MIETEDSRAVNSTGRFRAHSGSLSGAALATAGAVLFLAVGTILAWRHSLSFPPCCDVVSYWLIARSYLDHGMLEPHQWLSLRTWAYPAFLALWLQLAEWTGWNPRAILAVVQAATYAGSAAFLARALPDNRLATAAFVLFACNVFVIPYLAIGLADVIALTLFQVWLGAVLRFCRSYAGEARPPLRRWLAVAALSAGAALAVRPAYVWLPFITLLVALAPGSRDLKRAASRLLMCLPLMMLPLLPQVAINSVHFGTYSPMPTADLGTMQINWGKANFKYATALYPGSQSTALFYPSPFHSPGDEDSVAAPLKWYLDQPVAALATTIAKFVAVFDFDFIEPYVHHPEPAMQTPGRLLSLAILVLGLAAIGASAFGVPTVASAAAWRVLPALVLIGWGAVNLVSVPELRFALPMLSLFLLLIPAVWRDALAYGRTSALAAAAATACAVVALFTMGELTRAGIVL